VPAGGLPASREKTTVPNVAPDRDSQAVQFVKPNVLDRPGLSVGEDYRFADNFKLRLLKRAEDR
jgi:hypothetical protein